MKNKYLTIMPIALVLSALIGSGIANASTFFYDYKASVVPDDPSLQNIFSTNVAGSSSWSVAGGELTINTQRQIGTGIWFGNHATFDQVPWTLTNDSLGNFVSVTTKLGANSGEFSFYMYDGSYMGSYYFLPGKVQIGGYGDYSIDTTAYHTYSMQLGAGKVLYKIDGAPVYSGDAYAYNSLKYLIIGDGSGSNISGYGSMFIKDVTIQSPVPLPGTVWFFASGLLGLFAVRRKVRT